MSQGVTKIAADCFTSQTNFQMNSFLLDYETLPPDDLCVTPRLVILAQKVYCNSASEDTPSDRNNSYMALF